RWISYSAKYINLTSWCKNREACKMEDSKFHRYEDAWVLLES
ncbi:uncharacterized protein METZ01_LOCUS484839, partial [marine metagenome]